MGHRFRRLMALDIARRDLMARELEDEMRFHLEQRAEKLRRDGWPPDAAIAEAVRRYGKIDVAVDRIHEHSRATEVRMRFVQMLEVIQQDVRYLIRQLRRTPVFTAGVMLTFAIAIGANTTMFEIIDRLLLRPPAFLRAPGTVGRLYFSQRAASGEMWTARDVSYQRFEEVRDDSSAFTSVAAVFTTELTVGRGDAVEKRPVTMASASFWPLFTAKPVLGRFFDATDDHKPIGGAVAVLSYDYWRSRFGADPGVIGLRLHVGSREYEVIGIAPDGFTGFDLEPVSMSRPEIRFDAIVPAGPTLLAS
jgi:putative ABC transport system permease protein